MSLEEHCDGCKFYVNGECIDEEAEDLENCYVAKDSELGEKSE